MMAGPGLFMDVRRTPLLVGTTIGRDCAFRRLPGRLSGLAHGPQPQGGNASGEVMPPRIAIVAAGNSPAPRATGDDMMREATA